MQLLAVTRFSSIQLEYGEKLRDYEVKYLKCSVQLEATGSRETLVSSSRTAWRHFPEDNIVGDNIQSWEDRIARNGELDS